MSVSAIFLSASVPDPRRAERYFETSDSIAIAAAVKALAFVTLGRRLLVWGGHPSITPIIWAVAEDMTVDYGSWVHLYQSNLYKEDFPAENARFQNVTYVDPVGSDKDASLLVMRQRMLTESNFCGAVFIGGMEGVEAEYDLFSLLHPHKPVVPIASTGGASNLLYQRGVSFPTELKNGLDYVRIFHHSLNIPPREPRHTIIH